MHIDDFQVGGAGKIIRAIGGYNAFLPDGLPPQVVWNAELALAQSAADLALGRLGGVGQSLTNPHLLIRPFLRREAVLSSKIEGTQAELTDLLLFEASEASEARVPDVLEVHNYVNAIEHGLNRLKQKPLTLNLIRELHEMLMHGVRGQERTPGEFRTRQNWIGPDQCPIEDAKFVPPPPEELMRCLSGFETYLHAASELPPLVRLAFIHYQFEAIHPFADGNGRLGRLLITLLLCVEALLPQPLLYLSAYFERNQSAYYRHLLEVSQKGHWVEWAIFFLKGVTEQASDAVLRSNRILALRDEFRRMVQTTGTSSRLLELVDHLFASPVIRIKDAQRVLKVTPRAAAANVTKLIDLGLLREITGRQRNRYFLCDRIIKTVDERAVNVLPPIAGITSPSS